MYEQKTCNAAGIALIRRRESLSLIAYQDTAGIWTQGWGHTDGITANSAPITAEKAEEWFLHDVAIREKAIDTLVRYEIGNNQFSALVSFIYNIGVHNFERSSALTLLNAGDFDQVPDHMRLWNKDHSGKVQNGLIARREEEIVLWDTPDPPEAENDESSS